MKSRLFALFAAFVLCQSSLAGVMDPPDPVSVTLTFGNYRVTAAQLGHDFAPIGVSKGANTVVGRSISPNVFSTGEGLTWRRGQYAQSISGSTSGVNWDGKTVVGEYIPSAGSGWSQPYRDDAGKGISYSDNYGTNHPLGGMRTTNGVAVSGDGKVVVGSDNIYGAYSWSDGSTPISLPGIGTPKATSFNGSVIAGQVAAFGNQAAKGVLWTKSGGAYTMQDLPLSRVVGVTSDGKAVIGADAAGNAMRWQSDTGAVPLGFKLGKQVSVSADGRRILSTNGFENGSSRSSTIWDQSFGAKSLLDYLNHDLGIDFFAIDAAFGFRFDDSMYMGPLDKSYNLWNAVMSADGFSFAGVGPNEWISLSDGFSLSIEPIANGPVVPEPSTLAIAAFALGAYQCRRRFINRRQRLVV